MKTWFFKKKFLFCLKIGLISHDKQVIITYKSRRWFLHYALYCRFSIVSSILSSFFYSIFIFSFLKFIILYGIHLTRGWKSTTSHEEELQEEEEIKILSIKESWGKITFRLQVKEKHYVGKKFQSLVAPGKKQFK